MTTATLTPPPLDVPEQARPRRAMKTPEPEAAPAKRPIDMICLGDVVIWTMPGSDPMPAIVRKINADCIALAVINERHYLDTTRTAVHHVSEADRLVSNEARRHNGLWDFTDRMKAQMSGGF